MYSVLIIGAGSIGNHLAYACRQKSWSVDIYDVDSTALERMKGEIYPSRYGSWDPAINLLGVIDWVVDKYDFIVIGTPPDTHIGIATEVLKKATPKVLLIEKPLCTPSFEGYDDFKKTLSRKKTTVLVGYNHNLTQNTKRLQTLLRQDIVGNPSSIHVRWLEHWGGIFEAHPWLDGPKDSYLGYSDRGGGACSEHSHGINLWQTTSNLLGMGPVTNVAAMMNMNKDGAILYDRSTQLLLKTSNGLVGTLIQDVITAPPEKLLRIQGDRGFIEWHAGYESNYDAVRYGSSSEDSLIEKYDRTRPRDFQGEIDHVETLLVSASKQSIIALEHGEQTMKIIAAAFKSAREQCVVVL